MKKFIKLSAIILGSLFLLALIWVAMFIYLFTGVNHYVPEPVYSADREKVIIPTINYSKQDMRTYLCVNIEIRDTHSGKSLFTVQTYASDRMKWSVDWVGKNIVELDSSDIGGYCWTVESDNWGETECP
jgi:hypothetical protein